MAKHRSTDGVGEKANTVTPEEFPDTVLIVEDNLIIAMDTEQCVSELGAQTVHVANSTAMAIKIIGENQIDFALLDYNLGENTSETVAVLLKDREIPFVFASGYSEQDSIMDDFADTPIIKKPYGKAEILTAVADACVDRR